MAEVEAGAPTPADFVVNETPAVEPAPAPDTTAVPETEGTDKPAETPDEPRLTQSEVNKIVAKRVAQESRRLERVARAEAEASYLREQLAARDKPVQSQGEPDPQKFKDFDSYNAALISHRVEQAVKATLAARDQESTAQQRARTEEQRGETLKQKFASAEEKYPDFREALADPELPFNGAVLAYIEHSKLGGDVAYHLAQNKSEAARIAALPSIDQVLALHAIESKLSAPPKATTVPAPIVPSAPRPSTEKKLEEAQTQEEFNAIRKRQIAARKGIWK